MQRLKYWYLNHYLYLIVSGFLLYFFLYAGVLAGNSVNRLHTYSSLVTSIGIFYVGIPALLFMAVPGLSRSRYFSVLSLFVLAASSIVSVGIFKFTFWGDVQEYFGFEVAPVLGGKIYLTLFALSLGISIVVMVERISLARRGSDMIQNFIFPAVAIGIGFSILFLQFMSSLFGIFWGFELAAFLSNFLRQILFASVYSMVLGRLCSLVYDGEKERIYRTISLFVGFLMVLGFPASDIFAVNTDLPFVLNQIAVAVGLALSTVLIFLIGKGFSKDIQSFLNHGWWVAFIIYSIFSVVLGLLILGPGLLIFSKSLLVPLFLVFGVICLPALVTIVFDRPQPLSIVNAAFSRVLIVTGLSVVMMSFVKLSIYAGSFVQLGSIQLRPLFMIGFTGLGMLVLAALISAWDRILKMI